MAAPAEKIIYHSFPLNRVFRGERAIRPHCVSRTPGWWQNYVGWTRAGGFGNITMNSTYDGENDDGRTKYSAAPG